MFGIEIEGIDNAIVAIAEVPKRTDRALVRAMNRGIDSAKTLMSSLVAKDAGLKVGVVKEALPVTKATGSRPEARLAASLKRIPLMDFSARQTKRGVRAKLPAPGKGQYPNAFIARMRSGHEGVFQRVGKQRLPIRELKGPSIGHVFTKFRPQGIARAMEMFDKTFAHEMSRLEQGSGGSD